MTDDIDTLETLRFTTPDGVCGLTYEWDTDDAHSKWDANEWLEKFGTRIGSGTAPLPAGDGFVDMSQFSTVSSRPYKRKH